jgi:hypothetical protein
MPPGRRWGSRIVRPPQSKCSWKRAGCSRQWNRRHCERMAQGHTSECLISPCLGRGWHCFASTGSVTSCFSNWSGVKDRFNTDTGGCLISQRFVLAAVCGRPSHAYLTFALAAMSDQRRHKQPTKSHLSLRTCCHHKTGAGRPDVVRSPTGIQTCSRAWDVEVDQISVVIGGRPKAPLKSDLILLTNPT